MKHTPAPWHYEPEDRGDDSVGMQGYPPFIYADPQNDGNVVEICTISQPIRRVDREPLNEYDECMEAIGDYDANARLIAATPELLEACKAAEYVLRAIGRTEGGSYEAVRAAIAKATGEA